MIIKREREKVYEVMHKKDPRKTNSAAFLVNADIIDRNCKSTIKGGKDRGGCHPDL